VATRYPADGLITVEVTETVGKEWTLSLRVPGWAASGAELTVAGETQAVSPGTVTVHRAFEVGDVVTLSLPVAARWTAPDPRIDALRGQLAVERGPVVLCLESTDAPTIASVNDARVVPELDDDNGHVTVGVRPLAPVDESWPFGATGATLAADAERVTLVPYYYWANRGPSTMRVWLPVAGADSVVPG
jgi:DUF1680 family protein